MMTDRLLSKFRRRMFGDGRKDAAHAGFAQQVRDARTPTTGHSTASVEEYYDKNTSAYLEGFGAIFQGSRPESTDDLLDYLIKAIQLEDGVSLLDAGCGIGGPAIAFAERLALDIEGLTLAEIQVSEARARSKEADLRGTVNFSRGDFHDLAELYEGRRFDRVLFLESLCHAEDYRKVLEGAKSLLKQGGKLYIKDFYAVDHRRQPERAKAQAADLQRLTDIYKLVVPDLVSLVDLVSELGFQLNYVRMPEFEPTYVHWIKYEAVIGTHWAPKSGLPGEIIQGFELLAQV